MIFDNRQQFQDSLRVINCFIYVLICIGLMKKVLILIYYQLKTFLYLQNRILCFDICSYLYLCLV